MVFNYSLAIKNRKIITFVANKVLATQACVHY